MFLSAMRTALLSRKTLPYGTYIVRQTKGWEGRELMDDFEVYIAQDGQTYRYLINNANFESFIKVVKVDAETGVTIPYAGAGFQIYRPDGSKVEMTFTYPTPTTIDTFYTNSEGYLVTRKSWSTGTGYSPGWRSRPLRLCAGRHPVYFDVTEDNSSEEGGVTVIRSHQAQHGPKRNHQSQQNRRGILLCNRKRGRLPAGV